MTTRAELTATVRDAARRAGLDVARVELLRKHASSVFGLSPAQVVGRVSRDAEDQRRARTSLAVTRWLVDQDFPATAPVDVDQPVRLGEITVTFWRYYPQHGRERPRAAALGAMLRRLHELPPPPVELPGYRPLQALGEVVERSVALPEADRAWLARRRHELLDATSR